MLSHSIVVGSCNACTYFKLDVSPQYNLTNSQRVWSVRALGPLKAFIRQDPPLSPTMTSLASTL